MQVISQYHLDPTARPTCENPQVGRIFSAPLALRTLIPFFAVMACRCNYNRWVSPLHGSISGNKDHLVCNSIHLSCRYCCSIQPAHSHLRCACRLASDYRCACRSRGYWCRKYCPAFENMCSLDCYSQWSAQYQDGIVSWRWIRRHYWCVVPQNSKMVIGLPAVDDCSIVSHIPTLILVWWQIIVSVVFFGSDDMEICKDNWQKERENERIWRIFIITNVCLALGCHSAEPWKIDSWMGTSFISPITEGLEGGNLMRTAGFLNLEERIVHSTLSGPDPRRWRLYDKFSEAAWSARRSLYSFYRCEEPPLGRICQKLC